MLPSIHQGTQVDANYEYPAVLVFVPINSDSYAIPGRLCCFWYFLSCFDCCTSIICYCSLKYIFVFRSQQLLPRGAVAVRIAITHPMLPRLG